MSDTYKIDEVENGMLWEVDCKKYQKRAEHIGERLQDHT